MKPLKNVKKSQKMWHEGFYQKTDDIIKHNRKQYYLINVSLISTINNMYVKYKTLGTNPYE